jgi:hypothetical protein
VTSSLVNDKKWRRARFSRMHADDFSPCLHVCEFVSDHCLLLQEQLHPYSTTTVHLSASLEKVTRLRYCRNGAMFIIHTYAPPSLPPPPNRQPRCHHVESYIQHIQDEHKDEKGIPLPDEWELVRHAPVGYDTPLLQNGTPLFLLQCHSSIVICFICCFCRFLPPLSSTKLVDFVVSLRACFVYVC